MFFSYTKNKGLFTYFIFNENFSQLSLSKNSSDRDKVSCIKQHSIMLTLGMYFTFDLTGILT